MIIGSTIVCIYFARILNTKLVLIFLDTLHLLVWITENIKCFVYAKYDYLVFLKKGYVLNDYIISSLVSSSRIYVFI